MERDYSDRVRSELNFYDKVDAVHDLPESQHYVNENHLRPLLGTRFPFSRFSEMVLYYFGQIQGRLAGRPLKVLSLGSGNCDFEIALVHANQLRCKVHCLELNINMLDRAAADARKRGLLPSFRFVHGDANELCLDESYDLILANYALHHFFELERIFEQVHSAMETHSIFLVADMIGRNGHLFWESTLDYCNRIWSLLPRELKYNHQLSRFTPVREQWDCSLEGFEGIRAEDILPLLSHTFEFVDFAPFYAFVSRFTDRDFGPNFKLENPLHRSLLDLIWQLDHFCCENKLLKPTQMLAALGRKDCAYHERRHLYFSRPQDLYELDDSAVLERFDPLRWITPETEPHPD